MSNRDKGLRRLLSAARYSWDGLSAAWRHEEAFRLECVLALLLIPAAFWIGRSAMERALLIASVLLIMIVELLNSAIEAGIDRIGPERHELSKRAKDIGSAAVMLALINAAIIWLLLLID